MTILTIETDPIRPVLERDYWGVTVDEAKANSRCVEITCSLKMLNMELSFNVTVSIPKGLVDESKEVDVAALTWLSENLPKRLSSDGYWDFFRSTPLSLKELSAAPSPQRYGHAVDVKLSAGIASQADAACAHLGEVRTKFESAKSRLSYLAFNNMALGFKESLSEARATLRTIEEILEANGGMGGYSPQDARNAMRDYENLARRQIESKHNYQSALCSLQRFAHGVSYPTVWGKRPTV